MSDESMEARWRDAKIGERRDGRVCVWVECAEGVDPRAEVLHVVGDLERRRMMRGLTGAQIDARDAEEDAALWPDDPLVWSSEHGVFDNATVAPVPTRHTVTPDGAHVAGCEGCEIDGLDSEAALRLRAETGEPIPSTPAGDLAGMTGAFAAWNEDAPARRETTLAPVLEPVEPVAPRAVGATFASHALPSAPQEPPAAPDVPEAVPAPEALIKPRRARRKAGK